MNNAIRIWLKDFKLKEKWGELVTFFSPLILSLLLGIDKIHTFLGNKWLVAIVVLILIITFWGWLHSVKNSNSISKLIEEKNETEMQKDFFSGALTSLPDSICQLMFNKWDLHTDARITIYRHTNKDFIPVSRYAKDPDFDFKNRKSYPKSEGYIGQFWGDKEGRYIYNLPDPVKESQKYFDYVSNDSNMLKKDLRELPMKSRAYYGNTLYDSNGYAFLLVMVESTNPEINNIDLIKEDLHGDVSEIIALTIKANTLPDGGVLNE